MLKIINKKNFILILAFIFISSTGIILAENLFDINKINEENKKFKDELNRWKDIHKEWNSRRELERENYSDVLSEDRNREFCNNEYCWKENEFEYIIEDVQNEKKSRISKNKGGVDITNIFFKDGTEWFDQYDGQNSYWKTLTHEYWKNFTYGQELKYINPMNDFWIVANNGRTVIYKGHDGEFWSSYDYGARIKSSINGDKWESINYGSAVSSNDKTKKYNVNNLKDNEKLSEDTQEYIKNGKKD